MLTAAYEFTRGDLGLSVPSLYGHVRPTTYYYTFLGTAVLCLLLVHVMLKSPIGYFMRAVRDDPVRAQSLGVDTTRVKLFAFVASSAMAGLAGALYAHYVLTLTPSIVDFSEMARIVIMVVIGGLGSFAGPIIAAPPVYAINTWLASWGEWSMVVFAAIVIVLMRAYPAGSVRPDRRCSASLAPADRHLRHRRRPLVARTAAGYSAATRTAALASRRSMTWAVSITSPKMA